MPVTYLESVIYKPEKNALLPVRLHFLNEKYYALKMSVLYLILKNE